MNRKEETIFALATAPGRSGVAVVRVSGAASWRIARDLGAPIIMPRRMDLRSLVFDGEVIDRALVVGFEAGGSFTGEQTVEFHLHGGRAVVARMLDVLGMMPDCRMAEAGEFTRRALVAGVMDLPEVESLGDLIEAETEAQRRQAVALLRGELAQWAEAWREALMSGLSLLEASIDFADEEDAPINVSDEVALSVDQVSQGIRECLSGALASERIREGFRIALVGRPNVGKSTLLNAIAGREVAIISPHAGTTRDVVEVACDIGGFPVLLQDMAGIRESGDAVEKIGVEKAKTYADAADMRLFLRCAECEGLEGVIGFQQGDLLVWTKADLESGGADVRVSASSGKGLEELVVMISSELSARASGSGIVAHRRQRLLLESALSALEGIAAIEDAEIRAERMRAALEFLGSLVGKVSPDDVLDRVFSRFCIGK